MKSNILLMGEINTGKTRSLITLLPEYIDEQDIVRNGAALTPFCISLEPGIEATLNRNLCPHMGESIHYHYLPPRAASWSDVRGFAKLANTLDVENLIKINDPRRNQYTEFLDLFSICNNFTCQGCQGEFGDISEWGPERAIIIDSLTGLTTIARTNMCGSSPFISLP